MQGHGLRRVLLLAAVGTVIAVALCLIDLAGTRDRLGGLVASEPQRPAAQLLARELPDEPREVGGGHDGPFYYAAARDLFHPTAAAPYLDRPRYRLQRVFFPALAWLVHPTGGGPGLVASLFAVNVAAVLLGGIATGLLSARLGGPEWPAVLFGTFLGSMVSLRTTTPDALASALALAALVASLTPGRRWAILAVALAMAAVLTKEATFVTLAGFALWRRDRNGAALVAAPALVAGAWYLWLARLFPEPNPSTEIGPPLAGWVDAIGFWRANYEPLGLASALLGLGLGLAGVLATRPRHPLWWPLLANLLFLVPLSVSVLAPERNASRMFLPLQLLGLVALVTRQADRRLLTERRRPDGPASFRSVRAANVD